MVLGEGGMDSWSEHLGRLSRDGVAVVERELDAERFECLEQFAQRHRIIPRKCVRGVGAEKAPCCPCIRSPLRVYYARKRSLA